MLNPWQTISRAGDSEPNKVNWISKLEQWTMSCCQLAEDSSKREESFPNAILPFYSVDMMLKYIRITYDVQEIDLNKQDENEVEEMMSNWLGLMDYNDGRITTEQVIKHMLEKHRIEIKQESKNQKYCTEYLKLNFVDLLKKIGLLIDNDSTIDIDKLNEIKPGITEKLVEINGITRSKQNNYLVDKDNIDIKEIMSILKEENLIKEQKWEYIINLESIDPSNPHVKEMLEKLISMRVIKEGDEIVIYNYSDKKLSDGIKILTETRQYFDELTKTTSKKILTREVGLNCFRDYTISQIMKLYSGGQREQDMLIKNLYRFNSITEMYRYLVDVLWKDAIIEYGIRQEIQKNVHSRKFIKKYYNRLFEITKKCFKEAFGDEKPYTDIYEGIFNQAVTTFIDETAQKS